ncbi:MAG: hypothetical protein UHO11_04695 [Treponema sp.]|nr:hypothetical protein [Treponema sp.]
MTEYNFYCDESCHLEHDNSNVMVLGEYDNALEKQLKHYEQYKTV